MTWIGDVDIPIISDKSTSVDIETEYVNPVDKISKSKRLYSELENGTYSVYLNPQIHNRSESLQEQRDGVISLTNLHGSACPVYQDSLDGFLLVSNVSLTKTSSRMVDTGEVTLRYIPRDTYSASFELESNNNSDFSVSEQSIMGYKDSVGVLSSGNTLNSDYTYSFNGNTIDYYKFGSDEYTIDNSGGGSEYSRVASCKLKNGNQERIYTSSVPFDDFELDNSLIRFRKESDTGYVEVYDGGWIETSHTSYTDKKSFLRHSDHFEYQIKTLDGEEVTLRRSLPILTFDVDSISSFDWNITVDSFSDETSYASVESDGRQFGLVRESNDGQFSSTSSSVSVTGLDSSKSYTFHIIYVPFATTEKMAQYAIAKGDYSRTFTQK